MLDVSLKRAIVAFIGIVTYVLSFLLFESFVPYGDTSISLQWLVILASLLLTGLVVVLSVLLAIED